MARIVVPVAIGVVVLVGALVAGSMPVAGIALFFVAILVVGNQVQTANHATRASQGNAWLAQFPASRYSFAHGKFGIAIEDEAKKLHLMEDGRTQSYPLADVRSWKTNLQTGGINTYGGGGAMAAMGVLSSNRRQAQDNERSTGLFISVRDVDKPVWRIKFSDDQHEEERQQARWMEILSQVVNES